jgi:hypothetical protein
MTCITIRDYIHNRFFLMVSGVHCCSSSIIALYPGRFGGVVESILCLVEIIFWFFHYVYLLVIFFQILELWWVSTFIFFFVSLGSRLGVPVCLHLMGFLDENWSRHFNDFEFFF